MNDTRENNIISIVYTPTLAPAAASARSFFAKLRYTEPEPRTRTSPRGRNATVFRTLLRVSKLANWYYSVSDKAKQLKLCL